MWLVAAILIQCGAEHFHPHRKFFWIALFKNLTELLSTLMLPSCYSWKRNYFLLSFFLVFWASILTVLSTDNLDLQLEGCETYSEGDSRLLTCGRIISMLAVSHTGYTSALTLKHVLVTIMYIFCPK